MKNNILVVEDAVEIREEICDILQIEGFNVFEAENGKIGYKIAKKIKLDLIITDVLMPEMNGFKLFKNLSQNKKTCNIPVIFLSARANKETIIKAKKLGTGEYIVKPVSPDVLLKVVYRWVKSIEFAISNI